MKVKIRLFGTLGQNIPGYRHSQEIEIEIPDRATAKDLLVHLEIPESQGATIIAEGKVLKAEDEIQEGVLVNVMQAIRGG